MPKLILHGREDFALVVHHQNDRAFCRSFFTGRAAVL